MSTPPTPLHPASNEEIDRANIQIPSRTIDDLDLNPGLYEDSDQVDDQDPNNAKAEQMESLMEAEIEDSPERLETMTLPFDDAFADLKETFAKRSDMSYIDNRQQSKLINYIDDQLLGVQRAFIKSQADEGEPLSLGELLDRLEKIYALVWYSVTKQSGLFGQEEYFIKLMNDLEEYIAHYSIAGDTDDMGDLEVFLSFFFRFFQELDLRLSFLIDGFRLRDSDKIEKLSATQLVRISTLALRLRALVVYKLDPIRLSLSQKLIQLRNSSETRSPQQGFQLNSEALRNLINVFEIEIGKLFEGVLDRAQS